MMLEIDSVEYLEIIYRHIVSIEKQIGEKYVTPWMRAREAASFLRCSITKLNELTDRGLIPFRRIDPYNPKSPRLFHRKDLVGYLVCGRNPQRHRLTSAEKKMIENLL